MPSSDTEPTGGKAAAEGGAPVEKSPTTTPAPPAPPPTTTPAPPQVITINLDEKIAATLEQLSEVQSEITALMHAAVDPLLVIDEVRSEQNERALALLRETEGRLKLAFTMLEDEADRLAKKAEKEAEREQKRSEREAEREQKQIERRQQVAQWVFMGVMAFISAVIAGGGLWVNKTTAETNRAIAERSEERALAVAQAKEPIELILKSTEAGKLTVRNESRVEAVNIEVRRTRLFYSATCGKVFRWEEHTWGQFEKLPPYGLATLTLTQPFQIPVATLTLPHGVCLKRADKDLRPIPAALDDWQMLGAPHDAIGQTGSFQLDGEQLPLCSEAAPCRVIEFVRATALHGKTFQAARDFDAFFVVAPSGEWIPDRKLGSPMSHTQAGKIDWSFEFADVETKRLFVAVAEWLKVQPRSVRDVLPVRQPFTVGIWEATGVAPPGK